MSAAPAPVGPAPTTLEDGTVIKWEERIAAYYSDCSPAWRDDLDGFLASLPYLTAAAYHVAAQEALRSSAFFNADRVTVPGAEARVLAFAQEGARRHVAAGHDPRCPADPYSRAYAVFDRDNGRPPTSTACTCPHLGQG